MTKSGRTMMDETHYLMGFIEAALCARPEGQCYVDLHFAGWNGTLGAVMGLNFEQGMGSFSGALDGALESYVEQGLDPPVLDWAISADRQTLRLIDPKAEPMVSMADWTKDSYLASLKGTVR